MANNKSLVTSEALERMYNNLTSSIATMTEDAVDIMMNLSGGGSQVELKDASNEVKTANHYIGENQLAFSGGTPVIKTTINIGDILYSPTKITASSPYNITYEAGYYKVLKVVNMGSTGYRLSTDDKDAEYLGESYLVNDTENTPQIPPEETPKVELKDASNEVKAANYYIGETDINSLKVYGKYMKLPDNLDALTKDENGDDAFIVYITGGSREVENDFGSTETITLQTGYYKLINYTGGGICQISNNSIISEYLGASYLVNDTIPEEISKVELKDASAEVKAANHYMGETTIETMTFCEGSLLGLEITEATPYDVGDIVYIEGGSRTTPFHTTATLATGYYKCTQKKQVNGGAFYILISSASDNTLKSEYLGASYLV